MNKLFGSCSAVLFALILSTIVANAQIPAGEQQINNVPAKAQITLKEKAEIYRKAAEAGNASAQFELGKCYDSGIGVEKNTVEAVKWYRKAADQGFANAQYYLGFCYEHGRGVEINATEAVQWYRKATEQGNAEAQNALAECYKKGIGVVQDDAESAKWHRQAFESYHKAAEQGDMESQYQLAVAYQHGEDVKHDSVEAVKWYRKAAEQGKVCAQSSLASCYDRGDGVTKNPLEAAKWYRKVAEQGGEKGQMWFAEKAQMWLAEFYAKGEDTEQDYTEAVKWYRKAAEQGDEKAQEALAECYRDGKGVPKDDGEAAKLYARFTEPYLNAAEQGDAVSQYILGSGYNKSKNYTEAVKWLRKAAEQGYGGAQESLGFSYEAGTGVTRDNIEAYKWLLLALVHTDTETSTHFFDALAERMTPEQIAEGKRRAAEFLAKRGSAKNESALISAASVGNVGQVKALLAAGVDMALLLAKDTGAYPTEVLLTEKASIPAIVDGKQVGMLELPIGTKLKLKTVQSDKVKVMFNGSEQTIPIGVTDFIPRVVQNCQLKAEQKKKAADLKLKAEDEAKQQKAAPPVRQPSVGTSFKGSGWQNTRPFKVSTPWEVVWDSQKPITIVIYTADDQTAGVAGNENGKGRSYQPKGGTFFLSIQTMDNWQVSVVPVAE